MFFFLFELSNYGVRTKVYQLSNSAYSFSLQEHVEGYLELSAKTKAYFSMAVGLWDADFYVKVDDDVHVNIGKEFLYLHAYKFPVVGNVEVPTFWS